MTSDNKMNDDLLFEKLKNDTDLNNRIVEVSKKMKENEMWIRSQVYYDIYKRIENHEKYHAPRGAAALPPYEKIKACYVEEVMNQHKLGWHHETFHIYMIKQQEQDDYLLNPFEVEEGVVQCPKCQSFKVYSYSMQLRSADEPMTTIAQCTQCKYKWSQNG